MQKFWEVICLYYSIKIYNNYNILDVKYSSSYAELNALRKARIGLAHGNGLIHLDSFNSIRGYNEEMIGYGPEDDLFNKLRWL